MLHESDQQQQQQQKGSQEFTCQHLGLIYMHLTIYSIHTCFDIILLFMYIPDLRLSFTRPLTLSFQRTCQSQIRPVPSTTSSSTQAVQNAEIFLGKDD